MNINNIPVALWTMPCLPGPLVGENIPGWDHRWPAGNGYWGMDIGFKKHAIFIFFFLSLCYLSSLGDLPGSLHFNFLCFSISGFLQSPFPCQHGLDGLFNGPAVDLLILEREYKREVDLDFRKPTVTTNWQRWLKKVHSDLLWESFVWPKHGVSFAVLI